MDSHRFKLPGGVSGIYHESGGYKPGDLPPSDPSDYLGWHAWADVQRKAGIKQKQCGRCSLWRTPQEMSTLIDKHTAYTRRGEPVTLEYPVCSKCASKQP